jgi:hypothetical protein
MSRLGAGDWRRIVRSLRHRCAPINHLLLVRRYSLLLQQSRKCPIYLLFQHRYLKDQHLHRRIHHADSSQHPFPQTSASDSHHHVSSPSPTNISVAFPHPVHHLLTTVSTIVSARSKTKRRKVRRRRQYLKRSSIGFPFCQNTRYPCLSAKLWLDFAFPFTF